MRNSNLQNFQNQPFVFLFLLYLTLNKYKQSNFDRYLLLFRNLLLSDASTEYDAKLINETLYEPLLQQLRTGIPTHKQSFYVKDLLVLKKTKLPIDPMNWGIGKEWFYWTDAQEDAAIWEAAQDKLQLRRWGLKDLLLEGQTDLINDWIESLDEEGYQAFASELQALRIDANLSQKLSDIACFRCRERDGSSRYYALAELLAKEDLFLLAQNTYAIEREVRSLGFSVLELSMEAHTSLLQPLSQQLDYLKSNQALFQKLAAKLPKAQLNAEAKHRLFAFFSGLEGLSKETLRSLALFQNARGEVKPLTALLASDFQGPEVLKPYQIAALEASPELDEASAQHQAGEVYLQIILPRWNELVAASTWKDPEEAQAFYQYVSEIYSRKAGLPKLKEEQASIYLGPSKGFAYAHQVFYHAKALAKLGEVYADLNSALSKTFDLALPEPLSLPFLAQEPFKLADSTQDKNWKAKLAQGLQACTQAKLSLAEKQALFALFQQLLPSKDLAGLSLFADVKGRVRPLQSLIAPEALAQLPSFLADFALESGAANAAVTPLLAGVNEVYPNFLAVYWQDLSAQLSPNFEVKTFYEAVHNLALASKSPKNLLGQNAVFAQNQSFVKPEAVFYHLALENLEASDYAALAQAMPKLTGMELPHRDLLPFCREPFLRLREGQVAKSLQGEEWLLSKEEIWALQGMLNDTKEAFFQLFLLEETDSTRQFRLRRRQGKTQNCYVDKGQAKLADLIKREYREAYPLLPARLYRPELRNQGLLLGPDLAQQLSAGKDMPEALLGLLLADGQNDAAWQAKVLQKIDKIILVKGQTYDKQSFEHQSLQVFRNKDLDHESVRAKIYLEDQDQVSLKLSDIAYENQLSFAIERLGKFSLNLSLVLPRFVAYRELLDEIAAQFVDYEAPTLLRRRAFEQGECPQGKVLQELLSKYSRLENAEQLAFVLLYCKQIQKNQLLNSFQIQHRGGEWVSLASMELFYLQAPAFIQDQACLHPRYANLAECLGLSAKRMAWDLGSPRFLLKPYIDKQTLYCSPIRPCEDENQSLKVLDFCHQLWTQLESENRPSQLELACETEGLLGLPWASWISDATYALSAEQLPKYLSEWLQNSQKQEAWPETYGETWPHETRLDFLRALGLQTRNTANLLLRRYLAQGQGPLPSQKMLNEAAPQLEAALRWLAQKDPIFEAESESLFWLRKALLCLNPLPSDLAIPILSPADSHAEQGCYRLETLVEQPLVYLSAAQLELYKQRHQANLKQLLESLADSNFALTMLEIKGIETQIGKFEEVLDEAQLRAQSEEWTAAHYLRWREEQPFRIYLHAGTFPWSLRFAGHEIGRLQQQSVLLIDKDIFLNGRINNLEDLLFRIKGSGWTEQALLSLLRYKNEGQSDETLIDAPSVEEVRAAKKQKGGKLKLSLDLEALPDELLDTLLQLARDKHLILPQTPSLETPIEVQQEEETPQ